MSAALCPGGVLAGRYTLVEHLSRGNVLDVYTAWSTERDCLCVAKMLRPDRCDERRNRESLIHEGRLLTALCHPHLVHGYEIIPEAVITADGHTSPVVVMETLTGATLSHLIETERPTGMDTQDAALLGRQLSAALHYLHGQGLLHLDLKPSNIVCSAGKAILLDLSLAQSPGSCVAGAGTVEYMAPEQLMGDAVDAPTDVWGLGGVLYRALTGRRPFPRPNGPRLAGCTADLTPLDRAGIDPRLRGLVTRCLAVTPSERPTLTDVRRTFDAILSTPTPQVVNGTGRSHQM